MIMMMNRPHLPESGNLEDMSSGMVSAHPNLMVQHENPFPHSDALYAPQSPGLYAGE